MRRPTSARRQLEYPRWSGCSGWSGARCWPNGSKVAVPLALATAVAKADGSLLTWGDGYEDEPNDRFGDAVGLLGHGPSVLDVEVPTRCLLLGLEPQLRVCSLSCGPEHTLALCEGGEMMSWGCGNDGRLGHAATSSAMQCFPRRIDHTRGTTTLGVIASRTSRWSGCGP